jgi:hypothetical protein
MTHPLRATLIEIRDFSWDLAEGHPAASCAMLPPVNREDGAMTDRLLVTGGAILDPDGGGAPMPADILIEDGDIAALLPPGSNTDANAERLDASGRLVLPGLVNAHTHSHGGLGKGLIGDRFPLELLLNAAPGVTGGC